MKNFLLAASLLAIGTAANAQDVRSTGNERKLLSNDSKTLVQSLVPTAFRGTGNTSAFTFFATDSMRAGQALSVWADYALPLDSGNFYGTNIYNNKSYAYLYNLKADASGNNDTSVTVLGFVSKWAGRIQPASTKMVSFNVWSRGTDKTAIPGLNRAFVYGKPNTSLASVSVKDTTLKTDGSFTVTALAAPLTAQNSSVYVGASLAYTWSALAADTFGLRSTTVAASKSDGYTVTSGDTLVNVNNMIQRSTNVWYSPDYESNGGIGDMIMAPIVALNCPTCSATGISNVRTNELTFFGNYPNPAKNTTNVKFSLAKTAKVSISLMDNTGRLISVTEAGSLATGEHTVALNLSSLASGTYLYLIETTSGDRIASRVTVAK